MQRSTAKENEKHGAERVDNDHQKTVQGKNQNGPDDKAGRGAGGNEGSKGQNVDERRSAGTGKEPGDVGDERGPHGGSGGGQGNRQNRAVNRGSQTPNGGRNRTP
jgi:hypothetical protein